MKQKKLVNIEKLIEKGKEYETVNTIIQNRRVRTF